MRSRQRREDKAAAQDRKCDAVLNIKPDRQSKPRPAHPHTLRHPPRLPPRAQEGSRPPTEAEDPAPHPRPGQPQQGAEAPRPWKKVYREYDTFNDKQSTTRRAKNWGATGARENAAKRHKTKEVQSQHYTRDAGTRAAEARAGASAPHRARARDRASRDQIRLLTNSHKSQSRQRAGAGKPQP
jgi:hypothetical protein